MTISIESIELNLANALENRDEDVLMELRASIDEFCSRGDRKIEILRSDSVRNSFFSAVRDEREDLVSLLLDKDLVVSNSLETAFKYLRRNKNENVTKALLNAGGFDFEMISPSIFATLPNVPAKAILEKRRELIEQNGGEITEGDQNFINLALVNSAMGEDVDRAKNTKLILNNGANPSAVCQGYEKNVIALSLDEALEWDNNESFGVLVEYCLSHNIAINEVRQCLQDLNGLSDPEKQEKVIRGFSEELTWRLMNDEILPINNCKGAIANHYGKPELRGLYVATREAFTGQESVADNLFAQFHNRNTLQGVENCFLLAQEKKSLPEDVITNNVLEFLFAGKNEGKKLNEEENVKLFNVLKNFFLKPRSVVHNEGAKQCVNRESHFRDLVVKDTKAKEAEDAVATDKKSSREKSLTEKKLYSQDDTNNYRGR